MNAVSEQSVAPASSGYARRLRRSWSWSRPSLCWLLLGVLPLLFFQTAIHEGSHCVMLEVTGLGCRVTAPFAVSFTQGGGAYGVTLGDDSERPLPVSMVVAPQAVAVLLIVALRWLARRVSDERLAIGVRL